MSKNQLVECKENIFTKIKNFLRRKFFKKEDYKYVDSVSHSIKETKQNNIESYEMDKKDFLELYEKSKKGEVDLLSLAPETLKKMCALLEEEIKIKERNNEMKRVKLNTY